MKHFIGNKLSCEMNKNTQVVSNDSSEIKCGRLCIVQQHKGRSMKVPVFVRVYRSCFEHYVVLYKDQRFSLQSGFISLKNCIVNKTADKLNQIRVTLNDFEGTGVIFETNSSQEAFEWLSALQPQNVSSSPTKSSISPSLSPVIPRSPLMPTLAEESNEDD